MNTLIKTKGFIQKPLPQQQANFGMGIGDLSLLLMELRGFKQDLINKIKEVDDKIAEHIQAANGAVEITNKATRILEETKTQVVEHIKKTQKGDKGDDADPVDENAIVEKLKIHIPKPLDEEKLSSKILSKIPKLDENKLTQKVLKAIPQNKASLKIIQESFEVDPMSVIEKIMELSKQGKFKLKKENIDGLEQTMSAFQNQLGRGYLHGGGDTVTAGTNVTITTNSAGKKVINASGGGSSSMETATPTANPLVWTVVNRPVIIIADNQSFYDGVGVDITGSSPLFTLTFSNAPSTVACLHS